MHKIYSKIIQVTNNNLSNAKIIVIYITRIIFFLGFENIIGSHAKSNVFDETHFNQKNNYFFYKTVSFSNNNYV